MSKSDFFFGKVYNGSDGATLGLSDLEPLARKVSAAFFTAQLNRMLKEHGGRLTISDGTSYPAFGASSTRLIRSRLVSSRSTLVRMLTIVLKQHWRVTSFW